MKTLYAIASIVILFANIVFVLISYIRFTKQVKVFCESTPCADTQEREQFYKSNFHRILSPIIIVEFVSILLSVGLIALAYGIQNFVSNETVKGVTRLISVIMIPLGLFIAFLYDGFLSMKYYMQYTLPRKFPFPSYSQQIPGATFFVVTIWAVMVLAWLTIPLFARMFGLF